MVFNFYFCCRVDSVLSIEGCSCRCFKAACHLED